MSAHVTTGWCVIPKYQFWVQGEKQEHRCAANNDDCRKPLPVLRVALKLLNSCPPYPGWLRIDWLEVNIQWSLVVAHAKPSLGQKYE